MITNDFLEDVLYSYFKVNVSVLNFSVSNVTNDGDNYGSDMKRLNITYQRELETKKDELSVIVKSFPKNVYQAEFVKEMEFFECELQVYDVVIPQISMLAYREKIAPSLYYCSNAPMLLLEDLLPLNYRCVARGAGLDMKHALLVVEKLAYLHAATCALNDRGCTTLTKFNKSLFRKTKRMSRFLDVCYQEVTAVCKNVSEFNEYFGKLTLAKNHIFDKIYNVHEINSNFKVLNHGDLWLNNILFRYDQNNRLVDVAFVDFQISCFTSPCLDLHYFLSSSLQFETRSKQYEIVEHYFRCLIKKLGKLHTQTIPERRQFYEDFRLMAYCGFGVAILTLPFIKATKVEGASLENFLENTGGDSFRYHCFNNEEYLKEMSYYLPFYDKLGIFDVS